MLPKLDQRSGSVQCHTLIYASQLNCVCYLPKMKTLVLGMPVRE